MSAHIGRTASIGSPAHVASLEAELAKLLAENAELRKLLADVRADLVARAEIDLYEGGTVLNISNGLLMRIDAAMQGQT